MKNDYFFLRFTNIYKRSSLVGLAALSLCVGVAAQAPGRVGEVNDIYFAPPPMPKFMLVKPDKQLTPEEMARQIEEAKAQSQATKPPDKP